MYVGCIYGFSKLEKLKNRFQRGKKIKMIKELVDIFHLFTGYFYVGGLQDKNPSCFQHNAYPDGCAQVE